MSSPPDNIYEPLPTATSIRVLLLAPGKREDSDIFCWLLPSDLDWDHDKFPNSTPRPVESQSVATGKREGEDEREFEFPIHLDMDLDSGPTQRMHPFQRYEALSYVWGDPSDPQDIYFDGGVPFPVTRNLYAALHSLRLPHRGRRLWIDALCIDQSNYEERNVQLGLMTRVYQQAQKVIAYLPLDAQDQRNINELVPRILQASLMYKNYKDEGEKSGSSLGQYTGPFNSISDLKTVKVARSESEPLSVAMTNAFGDDKLYLESFGLPPVDSPLWDSWRRLFTSPYFRRIWIAQEISLGNNLHIWFGDGEGAAEPLFLAHQSLDMHSAAMNMSYNAAWCNSDDDETEATLRDRILGSRNALTMSRERILIQRGRPRRRLIETLAIVDTFDATDPRDKVYALLGWTSDGASFTQYVNYAPWFSVEQTFVRFAKIFLERGEGIEVLLQAGFRDEDEKWPSWVPHWDNLERSVPKEAARSPGKVSTTIRVDESSRTLEISATILDDIRVINDLIFEKLKSTRDAIQGFLSSGPGRDLRKAVLRPRSTQRNIQEAKAKPTTVIAESTNTLDSKSASQNSVTTSQTDGADEEDSQETQILRTGFHEFLNYMVSLKTQFSDMEEGVTQITQRKWPVEYQTFLRKATTTTSHRLLCVTKGGSIGIAPKRTKTNDRVAKFEGCDIHFVLRPVEKPPGENPNEEGTGSGMAKYRLLGPAFFHMPESETRSPGTVVEKITIV